MKVDINEALDIVLQNFKIKNSEILPINEAYGRVLSEDITAVKNLPCFDNSALDGYAVIFKNKNKPYKIVDSVLAGDKRTTNISGNECIKIMTGAKMPLGADTIMRLEDCEEKDGFVSAPENLKMGEAHRFAGEEVRAGELLLGKNKRLDAASVMMLAAQGISHISVYSQPRVGIFSSGDEIVEPWQNADDDRIYNANAVGIAALLNSVQIKPSYLGIIKDSLDETLFAFEKAQNFDILITSGGASKGEADFMKTALLKLGFAELFERVNIRPGGPCKAYSKDGKMVFALPGNPMAAFLCAQMLVIPAVLGEKLKTQKVVAAQNLKIKSGRSNIVLGSIIDGKFYITDENKFGSGMIKPLLKSDCIFISNTDQSELCAGDEIFITRLS